MDMRHGKETARRILSLLLALVMCIGMLPVTALAVETGVSDADSADSNIVEPDAAAQSSKAFVWSEDAVSDDGAILQQSREKLTIGLYCNARVATVGGLDIDMAWGSSMGVDEDGVRVLTVDNEAFVTFGPRLVISQSATAPAGTIRLRVPRYVESHRNGNNGSRGEFSKTSVVGAHWSVNLDPSGTYYILTNKDDLAAGQNFSFELLYKFDTRNTQSGKAFAIRCDLLGDSDRIIDSCSVDAAIRTGVGLHMGSASAIEFAGIDGSDIYFSEWDESIADIFGLKRPEVGKSEGYGIRAVRAQFVHRLESVQGNWHEYVAAEQ